MRRIAILPLLLATSVVWADTPLRSLVYYSSAANQDQPGFSADADRGRSFVNRNWGVSKALPSCASCHTSQPANAGRHAVTGKAIAALSPAVNAERFSNPAKIEKWFKRNCNEVLGRACTAAEKADFIKFAMNGQPS